MNTREHLFDSTLLPTDRQSERMLVVRHGQDDESIIDGSFDNELVKESVGQIKGLSHEITQLFYESGQYSDVRLICSSKTRAHQTGLLISQCLNGAGIPTSLRRVDELKELYQGKMVLSDNTTYADKKRTLEEAWRRFGDAVETCDLHYRFGDPSRKIDSLDDAEALDGKFAEYGENQLEFSHRIYTFLRDVLQYDFGPSLPVIVGHRASVTKIQRIIGACSIENGYVDTMQPGELRFIERKIERVKTGYAEGVILPLRRRQLARDIIGREINHLHQQELGL